MWFAQLLTQHVHEPCISGKIKNNKAKNYAMFCDSLSVFTVIHTISRWLSTHYAASAISMQTTTFADSMNEDNSAVSDNFKRYNVLWGRNSYLCYCKANVSGDRKPKNNFGLVIRIGDWQSHPPFPSSQRSADTSPIPTVAVCVETMASVGAENLYMVWMPPQIRMKWAY